jgi:3-hydroxyisobutyrate dehydrogenase
MTAPHKIGSPLIGFIGVGMMGSLMALRLLRTGYQVTAYNRTREKLRDLVEHGAKIADTPRELAAHNNIVISCVSNDQALEAIMYGQDGVLAGASAETTLIDMSTVSPDASRKLHAAAQEKGMRMIDAPVSGSTPAAKDGQLVILVGGEHEVYEQCQPILEILGRASHYVGPAGSGTIMKLVINALLGVGMQAISEAVTLGQKAGLDRQTLLEVLGQTAVIAPAHKGKLENMKNDEYPLQFALSLMRKDLDLVTRLASEFSVPLPTISAAEQMYTAALAQGSEGDFSRVAQLMEKLARIE